MIEQNVQVVRCADHRIWVRLGTQTGCSACDNGNGCGAGVFAKLLQRKPAIIELKRQDFDVRPGQMVTLSFPEQVYLSMVLAYYGWPLMAAFIGAFAGFWLGNQIHLQAFMLDVSTLLGGMVGGSVVLFYIKRRKTTHAMLRSLKLAIYHPSTTANMCSGVMTGSAQE